MAIYIARNELDQCLSLYTRYYTDGSDYNYLPKSSALLRISKQKQVLILSPILKLFLNLNQFTSLQSGHSIITHESSMLDTAYPPGCFHKYHLSLEAQLIIYPGNSSSHHSSTN